MNRSDILVIERTDAVITALCTSRFGKIGCNIAVNKIALLEENLRWRS